MRVLKFGGTSVATPEAIRRVVSIVQGCRQRGPVILVVSALGGVTNQLLKASEMAAERDEAYLDICEEARQRHASTAEELLPSAPRGLEAMIGERFDDLGDLLRGAFLLRECSPRTRDGILSYGERLSSQIVAAALVEAGVEAEAHDARQTIVTDDAFGRARVDPEATRDRLRAALLEKAQGGVTPVVTGFIAATPEGQTTTLGRGGSDYTAALIGAAVDAEAIEIWTDVDGVLSADPRVVSEAFPQRDLSYAELMELSHFGAKVIYPPTIHPARSAGIPLLIKNTFDPESPGSRITDATAPNPHAIRGIASIDQVALMRLEGDGMVGVSGIAGRLFGALARQQVSVILISQGSSEHSICFAVAPDDTDRARRAVDEEFVLERQAGLVDELVVETGQAVIAAVGEEMRRRPGLAGRLFSVLGRHGVNVKAIAQGSSELNVSLVIERPDERRALGAIHSAFFAPRRRRMSMAVLGAGRIGGALLDQIHRAAPKILERQDLDVRVVALIGSRRGLYDRDGLALGDWRSQYDAAPELGVDILDRDFALRQGDLRVVVDCTASDGLAEGHVRRLGQGIALVSANKRPFSGSLDIFRRLQVAARHAADALFFEATVGAGLPVLSTLDDFVQTGDRIVRIDGVLSGTLNAVLDFVGQGAKLSEAVHRAFDQGLTEPHPWDDLSGADVGRKLCILARLSGRSLEFEDIVVEPLLEGDDWAGMDLDTFWRELPRLDEAFAQRQRSAADAGKRLRYVCRIEGELMHVGLEAVGEAHPAFSLAGPDNLVAFTTERYDQTPLVVSGPGAGPEVTAAGVFADALRAAGRLAQG